MPRMGGVEVIQRIPAETPRARFIVLTTYEGDEDIHRALQAGARACLLKGMTTHQIVAAICTVHAGNSLFPAVIAQKLAERVGTGELSPREIYVLEQIEQGKSNTETASELEISETTVKTHVNSLLGKLCMTDRTQAVTAARQRGIVSLELTKKNKSLQPQSPTFGRGQIATCAVPFCKKQSEAARWLEDGIEPADAHF